MRMDLTITDYPDRSALDRYMHGSAEVIGLQMLPVLGTVSAREEAAPYAAALGKAFQLTNFLRDIDEDLLRGRVYLPADELAAHGVDRDLLMWCHTHQRTDARVRRALVDQHAQTRRVYEFARAGIPMLHPRSRPCIAAALTLYSEILDRIEETRLRHLCTTSDGRYLPAAAGGGRRSGQSVGRQGASRQGVTMDRWQYLIVLGGVPGHHRTAGTAWLRRVPAGLAHGGGGPSGRGGLRGLGRDRDCRARVDLQPRVRDRISTARPDADRGVALLHSDPAVRVAHLQRRRHHSGMGARRWSESVRRGCHDRSWLHRARRCGGDRRNCAGIRGTANRVVPPCGVLDLDGNRRWASRFPSTAGSPSSVRRSSSTTSATPAECGFRSTSRWRTSCSAGRWSPRCCLLWERRRRPRQDEGDTVNLSANEIPEAFDVGAPAYDKLVDANPGYHMHLRLSAQRMRIPHGGEGLRLLGRRLRHRRIHRGASDRRARKPRSSRSTRRAACWHRPGRNRGRRRCSFVHSRIEDLADAGVSGPFDGILAAYLVRNVDDKDGQLRRFRDLLRPGGTLAVHEYSVRDSKLATAVWNTVCATVIIPSGRLRTGDASLYTYLRRSVNRFDGAASLPQQDAGQRLRRCPQRDDARLAAQHRAHVPRAGPAMSDPRAQTHPAPPGAVDASALSEQPRVVVVGAGIAGLAAATGLAERGVAVDLIERQPYLGGRVGGWTERLSDGCRSRDESRLPRVLPSVLQPAKPAAAHRSLRWRCSLR